MKKLYLAVALFLTLAAPAQARLLTLSEIDRVRMVKELLGGVDKESLQQTMAALEKARHPATSLEVKEAMAKTYVDIVKDFRVEDQKKKEWLYSMVCLNMAYLQLGGSQGSYGSTTELNRLIRKKLMAYLPADILQQPGFLYSL